MTNWLKTVMAVSMAVTLFGAGVALAKKGDDHGKGKGKSHERGRGGDHGKGSGSDDGGSDESAGKRGPGSGSKGGGPGSSSCDAASSAIQAFVDATCPCAGVDDGNGGTTAWKNHGQYVRCVSHAVRDAARSAGVKRRCAKSIVPCAAGSSCGKKNAVACVVGDACAVVSADKCTAAGGTASSGSCCSASPSGAFLD